MPEATEDVLILPPYIPPRPQSWLRRALRRIRYWLASLTDDEMDQATVRELIAQLRTEQQERIRLQVDLAVRTAERDAATRECGVLSLALKRVEEAVNCDVARSVAKRERYIATSQVIKADRGSDES